MRGHVAAAAAGLRPGAFVVAAVYSEEIARAVPLHGRLQDPGEPVTFVEFLRRDWMSCRWKDSGPRMAPAARASRRFPVPPRGAAPGRPGVEWQLRDHRRRRADMASNSLVNFLHAGPFVAGRLCAPARPVVIAARAPP